jgi:hypothetical protein
MQDGSELSAQSTTQRSSSEGAGEPSGHFGTRQQASLHVELPALPSLGQILTQSNVPSGIPGGHSRLHPAGLGPPSPGHTSTHFLGFEGAGEPSGQIASSQHFSPQLELSELIYSHRSVHSGGRGLPSVGQVVTHPGGRGPTIGHGTTQVSGSKGPNVPSEQVGRIGLTGADVGKSVCIAGAGVDTSGQANTGG